MTSLAVYNKVAKAINNTLPMGEVTVIKNHPDAGHCLFLNDDAYEWNRQTGFFDKFSESLYNQHKLYLEPYNSFLINISE